MSVYTYTGVSTSVDCAFSPPQLNREQFNDIIYVTSTTPFWAPCLESSFVHVGGCAKKRFKNGGCQNAFFVDIRGGLIPICFMLKGCVDFHIFQALQ